MKRALFASTILLPAMLMICVTGCGPGADMTTLEGTVTIDGKAIEGVTITFDPQFDGGTEAIGVTNANGHYEAMISRNVEGLKYGEYIVRVDATITDEGDSTVLAEIPPEYGEESTQTIVVESGMGPYDLDVVTQ